MKYGLIGEHLIHSKSPELHAMLGNNDYTLCELSPDELEGFMRERDFLGINVTVPYKKAVIPYLDEISETALESGSVNTVLKRPDGTLYGDNTDVYGFTELLYRSHIYVTGKKVLVLGSGGASGAVCTALKRKNAKNIVVISRSGDDNYDNISRHSDADIIVNTTPVGMFPDMDASPIDLGIFKNLTAVIDIIYNPLKTKLMLSAKERKIKAVGGMTMLAFQAAASDKLFFGRENTADASKIEKKLSAKMRNLVFIGMPGSGKTVIARRIAYALRRPFYDIDSEITKGEGRTPAEIITADGEDAFRKIETEYTKRICSLTGAVISTGGGVVTRKENKDALIRNSFVIYLIRDLNNLTQRNRPISSSRPIEEIAEERIPLYTEWSDMKLLNEGISETVSNLLFLLKGKIR